MYGVVSPMFEEGKTLINRLAERQTIVIAHKTFHIGYIGRENIVVVEAGIGKVAAAISTTLLLSNFKIDSIINAGSAGSLNKYLHVHDVIIGKELVYGDADATVFGYSIGQIPKQPARFVTNEALSQGIYKSIVDQGLKKIQGLIVTTDSFFGKKKIRENIVKNFPDGLASDMEGSSVAQVAHHFKVPYTVLRVISDEATDGAGFTFDEVIDEIGDEVGKILINYFESLS